MVEMPKLEGLSFRFAFERLTKNHLKLGDTSYRPDFMKGQCWNRIITGTKFYPEQNLRWGAAVSLVIGGGLAQEQIMVPDVVRPYTWRSQSRTGIKRNYSGSHTSNGPNNRHFKAFVYKQNPEAKNEEGSPILYSPDKPWIYGFQLLLLHRTVP